MEVGLESSIPTYAGGLGVLAGDTIRSAADIETPMVAATLLPRAGYFQQHLDDTGLQTEEPVRWDVERFMERTDARVEVEIEGRRVRIQSWRYVVRGAHGSEVPVYLLDTDLDENADQDRQLTGSLYGGNERYRLCQEVVLGLGGVKMLRALGYDDIFRFHLNEGHAALIILALLEEKVGPGSLSGPVPSELLRTIQDQCVFTTHTPVAAGHDRFSEDLTRSVLGEQRYKHLRSFLENNTLNMTALALRGSEFVNGVAQSHTAVSRLMHPGYLIRSITNGVHPPTWAAPSFAALFDQYLDGWRDDPLSLRHAMRIPEHEILGAHNEAKRLLIEFVNQETSANFSQDRLTIGFARRKTPYKRGALIFRDMERLERIVEGHGQLQIVFAGKAHPQDHEGKRIIQAVYEARNALSDKIPIAYLRDYDMDKARLMVAGSDVWLNTPLPPWEASGTSGMKAAVNGVPSLSVLDGWWLEGWIEGITGWAIGNPPPADEGRQNEGSDSERDEADADSLYEKLAHSVIPIFYHTPPSFARMMRRTISINGSFFNTQRMLWQYLQHAYRIHSR
jgi:starch phosphorylase